MGACPYKIEINISDVSILHMVKLVIVESPAKCKKIEQFLGTQNYKCVASFGHIRDIKDGLKGIDIHNHFKGQFHA